MGTETLLPGAKIPVHRHLHHDEVVFVHKGQGRATLEARAMTVVPGTVIYAPRQTWHGLHNTGTGVLQITWASAPAGLEGFFRELSRAGAATDAVALREMAQRHGIELRPEGGLAAPQVPGHRRHRRRRGGPGRRRGGVQQGQPSPRQQPQQAAAVILAPPPHKEPRLIAAQQPTAGPGRGDRQAGSHRRHRRRGHPGSPPASPQLLGTSHGTSGAPREGRGPAPPAPAPRPGRGARGHRRGRVKEVYMGGRWVRVVGEGPVISTGREPAGEDS